MPGYGAVKCRLIHPIGERYEALFECEKEWGHHHESVPITDRQRAAKDWEDLGNELCPTTRTCPVCGGVVRVRALSTVTVWDSEDGTNGHPGDMYFVDYFHHDGKCFYWDGCTGDQAHLIVVLPNGHPWHINGRASNCTMPDDRTHRCWVRHGEPPMVTVDKAGRTCAAGDGSIAADGYHGFLRTGVLTAG